MNIHAMRNIKMAIDRRRVQHTMLNAPIVHVNESQDYPCSGW